jgi:Xaa-Pro aminopeptidase
MPDPEPAPAVPQTTGIGAADYRDRLSRAAAAAAENGIDALLVTPGPDLLYLTGYAAVALERLTCLVLPADGQPWLVVPELERQAAEAAGVTALGCDLATWPETADPYAVVAARLRGAAVVAVDNHMWAEKTLRFAAALPAARQRLAGEVLDPLRMRKSATETAELARAAAAIDQVHARMAEWLRPGRTEREAGADIAAAIIAAGHVRVDFVIVGSGPNGASPHHEVSDRVMRPGDPVVVDIGGTTRAGYCSDETRMYSIGEPPEEFLAYYAVLRRAQEAAVAAVRPGVQCQHIDAVARDIITAAGYGDAFIHRTGHGIGMRTHEDPYIVAGNTAAVEPGMAFSVEPGIYLPGRHGARIEDIVVCAEDGVQVLNQRPRDLQVIG